MNRRLLSLLLCLTLSAIFPAWADETQPPEISAKCAILTDGGGEVLFEKNADMRALIASTTKLMTALVAVESAALDETVTPSEAACAVEGSSMYLKAGERYTVRQLLTGLLLASGNDAALALAEHCGGEREFVRRMNEKAAALQMADSHFENPHGLDGEAHYSTARDLAKLMAAFCENEELRAIAALKSAAVGEQVYQNHNKLLSLCPGCVAGKTGYTDAAGRCLVSCCERQGQRLICVTLNDPRDWKDQCALYDWGFQLWAMREVDRA